MNGQQTLAVTVVLLGSVWFFVQLSLAFWEVVDAASTVIRGRAGARPVLDLPQRGSLRPVPVPDVQRPGYYLARKAG